MILNAPRLTQRFSDAIKKLVNNKLVKYRIFATEYILKNHP